MIPGAEPYPSLTGAGATRLAADDGRIVVVGAGGWLGLATLELLHGLLGSRFHHRVICFGSAGRRLALRGGPSIRQLPLERLKDLPSAPSLVLHLAFLTQEKASLMPIADYIATNEAISAQVLDALTPIGAQGVFVASSGAVCFAEGEFAETSKGVYGRLKLNDEARFSAWATETGHRAVIARIFNLSGPYIPTRSGYALASFIADALAGRPIVINATRPVWRSYVAISELMSVVFGALTDLEGPSVRFDTAGDRIVEMTDIAETVREALGRGSTIQRSPMREEAPDRYVGDGGRLARLRDRYAVEPICFQRQVRQTATYVAENVRCN